MANYQVIATSGGNLEVRDPNALEAAIRDRKVPKGRYVVWSNDGGTIDYVEKTRSDADSAQSCGGDYSSVVVKVVG